MGINISSLGSVFEASLRILLLLSADSAVSFSEERICMLDYIAVYANDYGYGPKNLHGHGAYRFSEYAKRRMLIHSAIKELVLEQHVIPCETENGFRYTISKSGIMFASQLSTNYAEDYLESVGYVIKKAEGLTDEEMQNAINMKLAKHNEGGSLK